MADYDRRQHGGHNRRKRYRDDDDHYDRRQQRRRTDSAPVPVRFRRQLVSIADSPLRRWAEEVLSLANMVADNYDDEQMRNNYVGLVLQMVLEQPLKSPFIAAVVLVANALKPEAMEIVLERLAKDLESSISAGQWREVKLYLKFLACLQGNLEGDGVFPLLEELFNRAADLQTASSEDTIGTEIVKIILLTIPYAMCAAPGQFRQKAAELMDKTDIIASEPHALHALVDPYEAKNTGDISSASPSVLVLLQKQLQAEAAKDWELACLPRPWQMPLEDVEMQDKLTNARRHALPAISIPANVVAGPRPLFPEVYLSVYSEQDDIESVPGTRHIASSLIRDCLVDTINGLDFNRNATARFLMDIDCYFAEGTFVKRATPFDELRNITGNRSTWKPEDVAVDTVFSQLFQLPAPECKLVYYHSVLTEACKLAPAAIAPSLGRAIRYLYRNNPRMDLELSYRCVTWFSHHLSNFGFTWKWAEWSEDAALSDLQPAKWFLNGALDKEIRLSFAQRIQKTLPEAYQHLIGREKEQDVPEFKYKNPDTPFAAEGQEIGALLRRKATDEEIQPTIDAIQKLARDRALDPIVASTDVFVTAICWVGSKSLSHVLACIDRSKGRLIDAGTASPEARAQIISSVMAYWHAHPGVALSIIEKLLNYAILTPFSVADWAILADSASHKGSPGAALAQPHIYEAIFNTVSKVTARVRQLVTAPTGTEGCAVDEETRAKEVADMTELFRTINDALESWASGSKDEMLERGAGSETDEALIRQWGQRWLRVFRRRAAVEASFVADANKDKMVVDGQNGGT